MAPGPGTVCFRRRDLAAAPPSHRFTTLDLGALRNFGVSTAAGLANVMMDPSSLMSTPLRLMPPILRAVMVQVTIAPFPPADLANLWPAAAPISQPRLTVSVRGHFWVKRTSSLNPMPMRPSTPMWEYRKRWSEMEPRPGMCASSSSSSARPPLILLHCATSSSAPPLRCRRVREPSRGPRRSRTWHLVTHRAPGPGSSAAHQSW